MRVCADGKAVAAVVTFAPPSIQNAEVQTSVAAGLLATGAGGFQRPARIVEPNVTAGNHLPGDMHVVVLDEDQVALELAVFAEVNDVLDVALAFVVARMRFAGENELDRPRGVPREPDHIFELLKNKRCAL